MGRGRGNNSVESAVGLRSSSSGDKHILVGDKKIVVPSVEDGFNHREDGRGNILVYPTRGNFTPAYEWTDDMRYFRSLMFNEESGKVVSTGLPKFFNYTEDEQDTETLNRSLANNGVVQFTEKMDGSLIIRAVVDGEVLLRTRGTVTAGDHGSAAWKVLRRRYPELEDPEFEPDSSMLFEFITPDPTYKIIINYPEADLVLLDRIGHEDLRLTDYNDLVKLADSNGLRLVETRELPNDPDAMFEHIIHLKDSEGVVARCYDESGEQKLVKMKSADYLLRHRLRYTMNSKVVRQVCLDRGVSNLSDFEEYLKENDADWELVEDARPLVERFIQTRKDTEQEFNDFKSVVQEKAKEFPDRGDFARNYAKDLERPLSSVAFAILDDKESAVDILLKDRLDKAFAEQDLLEEAAAAQEDSL